MVVPAGAGGHDPGVGHLLKNERPKSVVLASCRDAGSAYGLVIEYGGVPDQSLSLPVTSGERRSMRRAI